MHLRVLWPWVVGFWLPVAMTALLPPLARVRMLDGTTMAMGPDPSLPFVSVSRHISAAPAAGAWGLLMGGAMGLAWTSASPVRADRLCASLVCTHAALVALLLVPEPISPRKHQGLSGLLLAGATWYVYEAWRRHGSRDLNVALVACAASGVLLAGMNLAFHLTRATVGYAYFVTEAVLVGACLSAAPLIISASSRNSGCA